MKQGDVWLVDLEPTIGAEIKKTRPAVIISDDAIGKLPLKIIAPITQWKDYFIEAPWMVKIEPTQQNGLVKTSSIDCFQIRSLSQERLNSKIGEVTLDEVNEVKKGIAKVIGI